MPAIWNINNSYNVNNNSNKKVSSKLAFNVGESFSGKITKKGNGNEVSIKLTDGWEFSAEVDGDVDALEKGFQRFEVEGFENGKLKLKLINKEVVSNDNSKSELSNIITKEGLSKKDIPLLEAMLKYNIPLSRENIKMVKGLVQFNEKIQGNPKEIEKFISKYLESKGIDPASAKGQEVTQKLEQFLNSFKSLSKEDVLLFLENNIEFTKENIESYNKLFKESGKGSDIMSEIKSQLKSVDILGKVDTSEFDPLSFIGNKDNKQSNSVNSSNVGTKVEVYADDNEGQAIKENIPVDVDIDRNNKINPKNISNIENKNSSKIESENSGNIKTSVENIENDLSKPENANNKRVTVNYEKNVSAQSKVNMLDVLKSLMGGGENQLNIELKDLINSRRSEFTTKEFDKAYNAINKIGDNSFIEILKSSISEYSSSPQKDLSSFNDYINKKIDDAKFGTGELYFNKSELEGALAKTIGKNITLTEGEFNKLKDIINLKVIKDEEASNGNIADELQNGNNVKGEKNTEGLNNKNVVSEENGGSSTNNEHGGDKISGPLKGENTEMLKSLIKDKMTSQELVKNIISLKGEEGKEIIKEILASIKNESATSEKVLDIIKSNISDIKLFNKITQEYYYLDLPVKMKEQEYHCKLILKDNRKDGKKIDSKNVKMVVTVKTANLGVVDGYIKVLENKIDIDLKSEKNFVKILDLGKEKLISNIKDLGFNISVKVSKKEDEVSLTSCREFFNENNRANIDIKV